MVLATTQAWRQGGAIERAGTLAKKFFQLGNSETCLALVATSDSFGKPGPSADRLRGDQQRWNVRQLTAHFAQWRARLRRTTRASPPPALVPGERLRLLLDRVARCLPACGVDQFDGQIAQRHGARQVVARGAGTGLTWQREGQPVREQAALACVRRADQRHAKAVAHGTAFQLLAEFSNWARPLLSLSKMSCWRRLMSSS